MGRLEGSRPPSSSNNGKSKRGKQPNGQARSLTERLDLWACHNVDSLRGTRPARSGASITISLSRGAGSTNIE